MIKYYQIFLLLVLITSVNYSQIKIHKNITTEDGLVDNAVSYLFQDSKGYVWVGTYDGLSKWDGNNFVNYTTANGLTHIAIFNILEAPDSTIYFAIFGGGVLAYKDGILDTIDVEDGLNSNFSTELLLTKDGSLLIASKGKIDSYRDGQITKWGEEYNLPDIVQITEIIETDEGKLYLATSNTGLVIIDNGLVKIIDTNEGLLSNKIEVIEMQNNNTFLIGTQEGINKLENGKITSLKYNGKILDSYVYDIHTSKSGKTYYATTENIIVEDEDGTYLLKEENGLANISVMSIMEDKNGMLYFGTDGGGINIYNPEKFETYTNEFMLPNKAVNSIHQDKKGTYYFATDKGVVIDDGKNVSTLTTENGLSGNEIHYFYETSDGKIFISSYLNPLSYYQNNIITISPNIKWRLSNNANSIAENNNGELIVGTRYGAYLVKNKNVTLLRQENGLINDFVSSLLVTKDSSIIYGSHGNGLTIYKDSVYKYFSTEHGLSNGIINVLYQSSDDVLWIGTDNGGVNIWKNNKIDTIDISDGLTSNRVQDITEDDYGKMYISTPNGVNIIEDYAGEIFIRTLTTDDGLVGNNCALNGTFKDQEGIIWIGTSKGVSKYDPSADNIISTPPKIYISGIEIFNKEYSIKKLRSEKKLSYDQNYIKFMFIGINFSAPKNILYKYRLIGIDSDWIESKIDWAQYTNLDAGDYTFEVKSRNEWNFWSKPESIEFSIEPIWWKTWWFRIAAVILIFIVLYAIIKIRISTYEKERIAEADFSKRLLQIEEKERERIASGLHDSLGQNLLVIKNRALLGLKSDKINFPKEQLSEISDATTLAINEVRQIAYNLHPYQLSRLGLTKAIQSIVSNIKETTKIVFKENIDNIDSIFSSENEIHIYRITQELINNVVKHSDASNTKIDIKKSDNKISLNIKDNGRGFDQNLIMKNKKKIGGFGFQNIKKRVNLLNGEIKTYTENGAEVHISIPIIKS